MTKYVFKPELNPNFILEDRFNAVRRRSKVGDIAIVRDDTWIRVDARKNMGNAWINQQTGQGFKYV